MRVVLEPVFILHSRPFSETSLILDVFTCHHGRICLIARGARAQRSRFRGLLRPFIPLLASWSGKTELMTLTAVEYQGAPAELPGALLLNGLYLNELLMRLLPPFDSHPQLFTAYQQVLVQLQQNIVKNAATVCSFSSSPLISIEAALRIFEKSLLAELGYGLSLNTEALSGAPIVAEQRYAFTSGRGFIQQNDPHVHAVVFQGKSLLALHHGLLQDKEDLWVAKKLMRLVMAALLGSKPLKSRELFVTC